MPKFSYSAINETGNTVSGDLEADTLENANIQLASRGLIPTRVREERPAFGNIQLKGILDAITPIKTTELILFTKQFNTSSITQPTARPRTY